MSVTLNGRSWSINDFLDKAHTQPKSPDSSGTPAFPDGVFNDFLSVVASVVAQVSTAAGYANNASAALATIQALIGSSPSLSSATYNGVLAPNRGGTGYDLLQWTTVTSAYGSTLAQGSHRLAIDTSGGPFTITVQGTPNSMDRIEVLDLNLKFDTNRFTMILNGSAAVQNQTNVATVIFDVVGDHAILQFIANKWRFL